MKNAPIDVKRVRELFNQPEKSQTADFIYREIASRMLERLQLVKLHPARIVDAGCGSGPDLKVLQQRYPDAQLVGVDASYSMLRQALPVAYSVAQRLLGWLGKVQPRSPFNLINSDFASLPLSDQTADLVWSNLALHWHSQPDQVFKEWRRVLSVNGLLMFSCFGPDSLKQLRQAFAVVDQAPHTLPFVDMHDFGDMLMQAGFATPVMDMEIITLTYETVPQLLADVRALGGNPLQTRSIGLMGKTAWHTVCQHLEQSRNQQGRLELTLEVIYGHAFKPAAKSKVTQSVITFVK